MLLSHPSHQVYALHLYLQAIIDSLKEATCPSTNKAAFAGIAAARVAPPEVLPIGTKPAIN